MTQFFQLHVLTPYAASNLNRDDAGRPKTLNFGGAERLRVSSQSLKRAFRTSDIFSDAVDGKPGSTDGFVGTRTLGLVTRMITTLMESKAEASQEDATKLVTSALAKAKSKVGDEESEDDDGKPPKAKAKEDKKGKLIVGSLNGKSGKETETNEMVNLAPEELKRADELAKKLAKGEALDPKEALVLVQKPRAADIALFGRMLADNPLYNVEAAAQVAHAFTTHRVSVEDDFYTAVDDLKSANAEADRGAGFIGVGEYGAGVFYLYINVDADQLLRNLAGDKTLAAKTLEGFIEAALTVSPKGKQNSYASRTYASYALAELGSRAPRSLAAAFVRPVGVSSGPDEQDYLVASIARLAKLRQNFDSVYGPCATKTAHLNTVADVSDAGSLASVKALAREAIDGIAS